MTLAEMAAIIDAVHPSAEQQAAEDAANAKLTAEYPGQYVAYRDNWDGNDLRREVVAAAIEFEDFYTHLDRFTETEQDELKIICVPAEPHVARVWVRGDVSAPVLSDAGRAG